MSTYSSKREALARLRRPAITTGSTADKWDTTGIGPDEYDGGAYGIASHYIDADGIEREGAHTAYVAAVAQPADVRALRLHSVQWHGGTGRIEDVDAGALADTARSTRESTRALVGPDGCNVTRTASDGTVTRERWSHLSRDAALWYHAVAGTEAPAEVHTAPEARSVVGAVPGTPRRQRTRHGVAINYVSGDETRTYVRTRPLTPTGQWDAPADVIGGQLPHTARVTKLGKEDNRKSAERSAADPARPARRASRARERREIKARLMAATALTSGGPIIGRADAIHVRLATAALVVSFLSCGTAAPVELVEA